MYGDAKPLTKVFIVGVISSEHPQWEIISGNMAQTKYHHGGDEMYIQTAEIGYGGKGTARLNGSLLELKQDPVSIVDNRNIIIGYYKIWNACGNQHGHFQYENQSIITPFYSYSVSLNII